MYTCVDACTGMYIVGWMSLKGLVSNTAGGVLPIVQDVHVSYDSLFYLSCFPTRK